MDWVVAGEYPDRRTAMEHALVVLAMDGACWIRREGGIYQLLIEPGELDRLAPELAAYDAEESEAALAVEEEEHLDASWGVIFYLWLMGVAYVHQEGAPARLLEAGSVSYAALEAGEWWRIATALTLHGDLAHLASNMIFGAVFVWGLVSMVGVGLTAWAFLLSGAGGNAINNLMRSADPATSIGASTAVFGLLGALVAVRVTRWVATSSRWQLRELLLPMGAGLALLALLGAEPVSIDGGAVDNTAHFWGFVAGVAVGPVLEWLPAGWRKGAVTWLLALGAIGVFAACWRAAG